MVPNFTAVRCNIVLVVRQLTNGKYKVVTLL